MMSKKGNRMLALVLASVTAAGTIMGCGGAETKPETETESGKGENTSSEAVDDQVPAFEEIEFPDAMPANPTLAEEDYYDYDDMSVHYDITMETYNYGYPLPEDDPIKAWLEEKYNVTLNLEVVAQADQETVLSTEFASGEVPDVVTLPSKEYGFTLGEQGILVDAKELYPYMPQTCKFVTKDLVKYSTMEDGTMPFTTKYAVQDGDIWNLAIRQDWLDKFGMDVPKTKEEVLEFAKACTFNDPDGNGKDDTYFMVAAGNGSSMGMLEGFLPGFGNPETAAVDGKLEVPMLNGTTKAWVEFLNELYEAKVFPADWYSIEWEASKSYSLNDKVGMVRYPAKNLYEEYCAFQGNDYSKVKNWTYLPQVPIENGKGAAGGNQGTLLAIPKANVEDDAGKLKRICHILDAMCYGGEAYFETVQGGGLEVYADKGYTADVREYTEDGLSICYVDPSHPGFTEDGSDNLALAPWQNFGYSLKWQKEYSTDEEKQDYVSAINDNNEELAKMDRWPNSALLYTKPAEVTSTLNEFAQAQLFKFVTGERKMDEWNDYVQEWLQQGGKETVESAAEQLGVPVPDGI